MTPEKFKEVRKVLLWVKEQILAHPKQYDQGEWCGTTCCIAGWIDRKINGSKFRPAHEVCDNASRFLTGSTMEPRLSTRGNVSLFMGDITNTPMNKHLKPGTKAYAEAGARAIDAYLEQEEYRVSVD
jgi:hypothetical protein